MTSMSVATGNAHYDSRDNCNAIILTDENTLIAGCRTSTLPATLEGIGYCAFLNQSGLTSIDFPESLTNVGESAFAACTGLTSIALPNSVISIGESAFFYCTSMSSIFMLPPTPPATGAIIFKRVPLETVYVVDENAKALYQAASPWNSYSVKVVPTGIHDTQREKNAPCITDCYDLCGKRLEGKRRGPVIVRYNDGSTRKVMVK